MTVLAKAKRNIPEAYILYGMRHAKYQTKEFEYGKQWER
jgi:hypothetical protein